MSLEMTIGVKGNLINNDGPKAGAHTRPLFSST